MKLMFFSLAVALCLIFDQLNYRGHYLESGVAMAGKAIATVNPFGAK